MSSPSIGPSKSLQRLAKVLPHYVSRTDVHISHVNRLLTPSPYLDTTLMTLTYTLHLLHAFLTRLSNLPTLPSRLTLSPSALLPRLTTSTVALSALIDDFRIFARLPALLSVYAWGASTYRSPPSDKILKTITWAQVVACAIFQGLENGAYLAGKGVVGLGAHGVAERERRSGRWYTWSSRFWMCHVLLDFVRLGRVRVLRRREEIVEGQWRGEGEEGPKELVLKEREGLEAGAEDEEQAWWRKVYINAAWLPLTMHYSMEEGFAGEASVAVLGLVPGIYGIRDAWKATASGF